MEEFVITGLVISSGVFRGGKFKFVMKRNVSWIYFNGILVWKVGVLRFGH